MINYEFVPMTPNGLEAQELTYELPLNPTFRDESELEDVTIGMVGVAINGIPIFSPNEAANLGFGDPYTDNILDFCNGHTGAGGIYHYHARPNCLLTTEVPAELVGTVIGYGLDGFPILTPYICVDAACTEVRKVQSSYQLTHPEERAAWDANEFVAGSGDLDRCNGLMQDDGSYAYYATDTFPYMLGCFRGEVDTSMLQPAGGPGGAMQGAGGQGQPSQTGQNGQAGQSQPPQGGQGQPPGGQVDLAAAAATLGVTEDALRNALGDPRQGPPNLAAAAAALGVTEAQLAAALNLPSAPPGGRPAPGG